MKLSAHLSCYQIITALYPQAFRSRYQNEMQLLFEDQLRDEGPAKIWAIIIRELPASLWREHYQNIVGAIHMPKIKTVTLIICGVLGTFILPMFSSPLLGIIYSKFGIILTGPLGDGGYLAIPSMIIYFVIGAIIGMTVNQNAIKIAAIAGAVGFVANFFIQGQFESFMRIGSWPTDQINQVLTFGIEYALIMALAMTGLPAAGAYLTQHFLNKSA